MNWLNSLNLWQIISLPFQRVSMYLYPFAPKDTPTRQAYRRVLRMMEDPDLLDGVGGGMAGLSGATAGAAGNIFDDELDEDGNAIQKGNKIYTYFLYGSLYRTSPAPVCNIWFLWLFKYFLHGHTYPILY